MIHEQLYAIIRYVLILLGAAAASFGWFAMTDPHSGPSPFEVFPPWWWGAL